MSQATDGGGPDGDGPRGGGEGAGADPDEAGRVRRALARDELTVQYQPVVRTEDAAVAGMEALLRWRRPDGGLADAAAFLGPAARAGMLPQVDLRSMTVVARDMERARLPPDVDWISVNLVPASLDVPEVRRRALTLADELERRDLGLVLELSEGPEGAGVADGRSCLARMRERGIRVAVDGFGSGPDGFERLLRLPADMIKMNGAEPRPAAVGPEDARGFRRALVRLTRALGREVVLVRVDDRWSRRAAVADGADFVQGRFVGPPRFLDDRA